MVDRWIDFYEMNQSLQYGWADAGKKNNSGQKEEFI